MDKFKDKFKAGLGEFSQGLSQGLSNIILGRRRSRQGLETSIASRSQSPSEDPDEKPPEYGVDFEVEEEQVMKGLELVYHDKLNEADEYFETLKSDHARFSLHHAEVSVYVALMSFDPEDVEFAIALLQRATLLAIEQARRWRTHSKLKKVVEVAQETVGVMKAWAMKSATITLSKAGPAGAQASALLMPNDNLDILDDDDDDADVTTSMIKEPVSNKLGEVIAKHRARRMRLWALLIQGECHLMTSLLQVVAAGESWTDIVKLGFNVKRTWSLYQHCQNKLRQLQNEWVALGGTFNGVEELPPNINFDYDSDDETDEKLGRGTLETASSSRSRRSQNYDPVLSAPTGEMVYQGVRAAAGNLEKIEGDVNEDQELASLRIGVQFGIGSFNLLVSLIPNYQKAIELIGVPADRNHGLALLRKVSSLHHCRAPLAAILLLHYYTVIMGLLPHSEENTAGAQNVISMLPIAWKESSIFRLLQARLSSYECRPQVSASSIDKLLNTSAKAAQGGGLILKLRSLMMDELAWSFFLQGDFVRASEQFGALYKETSYFKPLFAFLQSSCFWEADKKYHGEAAKLLRDISGMIAGKKSGPTAMEQFALHIADVFIKHGQVPLFPALETIAVYNGFHHMNKVTLKRHMDRISDALKSRCPKSALEYEDAFQEHKEPTGTSEDLTLRPPIACEAKIGEVITSRRAIAFQSKSKMIDLEDDDDFMIPTFAKDLPRAGDGNKKFEHTWTKESKILCRYLLALCQRGLGDIKQAKSNFCYVINQTDVMPGNILPYACYELGSLLLDNDAASAEGLNLLEKSVHYPSHEFQTRLKFVVHERLRMFRKTCESTLSSKATTTSALNLRRVSELLRIVSVDEM